jgi:2-methylaconitate cis-trans-isomerase PrpF
MDQVPAVWMRGGTSKCWVFLEEDLRHPTLTVDEVLLRLFGSPDSRQVDGVGGGTSTTSKAVILSRSARQGVDVDYTFAQVGITKPLVDWGSNCGNCSAVVAPYAVAAGWIPAVEPLTTVRVLNTNTQQMIIQQVAIRDGALDESPVQHIPGVPFPGPAVRMGFLSPAGRTTGQLLPSGSPTDQLDDGGSSIEATLIDAGAPLVILRAADLGLTGSETTATLDARPDLLARLDQLRRNGAVTMGMASTAAAAARAIPKLAVVAAPSPSDQGQIIVRMLSMGLTHPAIAITGSIGITIAASTPGTIVHDLASPRRVRDEFDISTPAGVVTTWTGEHDGESVVGAVRSYRRLAQATLPLPTRADKQHSHRGERP